MIVKFIPEVFEQKSRETIEVEYKYETLGDLFERTVGQRAEVEREGFAAIMSGKRAEWDQVPSKHDEVIFVQDLQGGGGGGLSGIFGAVLTAVGALITYVAPYLPIGPYMMKAGVALMAGAVVGYLAGALFTPDIPTPSGGFRQSQTYSWDGVQNLIGEGNVVPVVLGRHRVGGAIVEAFIEGGTTNDYGLTEESYLSVLTAISEGEISAIDTTTAQVNKKEIAEYSDITTDSRLGTSTQTPIDGFSKIERHYSVTGVQLKHDSQYVYKTNGEVDAVRLTIMFPALFFANDDGSCGHQTVEYRVEYAQYPDGAYTLVNDHSVTGWYNAKRHHITTVDFPSKGVWLIRLTRLTEDFTTNKRQALTYFTAVSEIEKARVAYRDTALFGCKIKATDELSGTVPTITVIADGVKFKDVRNLSAAEAWTDNPANILYGLLRNERWGLGRRFSSDDKIDIEALQDFADWCDELVPYRYWDGSAGQFVTTYEKRYTWNMVLDAPFTAMDMINKICGSCRAMPYWIGDKLSVVIERPQEPVQLFSEGNIVPDSLEETYIGLQDVPNQVQAQFLDEDDDYRRQTVVGVDRSRLNEKTKTSQMNLYGLTKKSRVKREVVWALKKAKAIEGTIKFQAGFDAIVVKPGQNFYFQHQAFLYGDGGRIKAIGSDRVTLDSPVTLEQGETYRLRLRKRDNTFVVHDIVAEITGDTDEIKINTAPDCEAGDVYAFGKVGVEARPYRAVSVIRIEDSKTVEIVGETYNESIFNEDENITVEDIQYAKLGEIETYELDGTAADPTPIKLADNPPSEAGFYDKPSLVTEVTLTERVDFVNDQLVPCILVGWEAATLPSNSMATISKYEVLQSVDGGATWNVAGSTKGTSFTIRSAEIGVQHHILIRPITNYNVTNSIETTDWALAFSITPTGQIDSPNDVTGFLVVQNGETLMMRWDIVTNTAISRYEVRANDWDFGETIGTTTGSRLNVPLTKTGDIVFYIKAINASGVESENATTFAITVNPPANRNVIFEQDSMADGWPGVKNNVSVNLNGELALDAGDTEGSYVSGFVSLADAVRSRNILDYNAQAIAGYVGEWDDCDFTWDDGANQWETIIDKSNVVIRHEISMYQGLETPWIDIIRLADGTDSVGGNSAATATGVVHGQGTFHKGVVRDGGMALAHNLDTLPDDWSIFFRYTLDPNVTLADGTLIKFSDGTYTIEVDLYAAGSYRLTDGSEYIEIIQAMAPGDNLLIGIGNNDVSGELMFFVGNVTTGLSGSGSSSSFSFTKPTSIIMSD